MFMHVFSIYLIIWHFDILLIICSIHLTMGVTALMEVAVLTALDLMVAGLMTVIDLMAVTGRMVVNGLMAVDITTRLDDYW